MWNWEHKDWPSFSYNKQALVEFEEQFLINSGMHIGVLKHISDDERDYLRIELLSEEALKTSEIEGEFLDRDSLQSSFCLQFDLKTDYRKVPPAEQGIASMMVDLYKTFDTSLTHEYLWQWHKMLFNGQQSIKIGAYRDRNEPMRIVSGAINNPKIHFEAPPALVLHKEMEAFIRWYNNSSKNGENPLPALTRSAIAHLYFVSIHPFEDGNGRIARAIAEKSLSQSLNQPSLISLAYTIQNGQKDYFAGLERNNKGIKITDWIIYFAKTVLTAQENTRKRIEFIIEKTKLYDKLKGIINSRQEKAIERMLREGIGGFKGGLSAKNYRSITSTPSATATRDLNDLVDKGALIKIGRLKHTRYYLNIIGQYPEMEK